MEDNSTNMPKLTFEECLPIIDDLINRRKYKWSLTGIAWMNYDDVAQILRLHIFNKFHLYDHSKKLEPWVNRIITCQLINLSRNLFYKHSKPCLQCAFNEDGGESCGYTASNKQDNTCPVYRKWSTKKKPSHDINLPVAMSSHENEVNSLPSDNFDLERSISSFHVKMEGSLRPIEWKVYKCLYIDKLSERETCEIMGYTTTERGRMAGYNNILRIKKKILKKAEKIKEDIDYY